ncbi:hypothetical protein OA93_12305 [Flavobacterium sp. KMS]|uniref:hypothetical protein n=1 Tax=Flavobacterium sp. KMS TaxID=1566023 RepID=UPI00057D6FAC|nr:hypothetical protein [Flavobacterium sp. KMS]KIA97763.1 hypothetical protein OA93_12305 [Flavobacterium sp. KMS]
MNSIEEKKVIVEKWLGKNGFSNIKFTDNNYFVKADGRDQKMFITIKDNFDLDKDELKKFATKNYRQAWIADVKNENEESIDWEYI